ncbi:TPA: hypothetical protein QDB03_002215 [Burkholderia vietnamiensis]|uniref:hypothetical protein n=1 Tax=Burkholderia vietnamiensis TaxID=60552 RepID=UPI001B8EF1D0|nr:hypothetical protein [Burkholderia vietnamiensis]MBR8359592.1 hypothetical protein [Burkholderia vietnamiensis]UKV71370.1 hypothetical protein FOC29_00940 [Burkholderia vietnamiensis]HDR9060608.1 hypothetical protein [Burkholderia vietnamiensis]HDR9157600.1 hypothetical protein [Burkholderia vietnamiensis]
MSEKFAMKVVIDDVTCPLLHARLSLITAPRERAALLRAIAEAALRGEASGATKGRTLDVPARQWDDLPATPPPVTESTRHRPTQHTADDTFAVVDTSQAIGIDAEAIAEGLGAYF